MKQLWRITVLPLWCQLIHAFWMSHLEWKCPRFSSRTEHILHFTQGPTEPSPNTKSSKTNRLCFGFEVLFVRWDCTWWAFHPKSGPLVGALLEGQNHPVPRSLEGLEAELACLLQARYITDVTLWFPTSALKYSKLTKATVEFRTNTGGMFSYLFL